MQLERPTPKKRVRVTASDAESGKSKTITVYDTTPQQVIDHLKKTVASEVSS